MQVNRKQTHLILRAKMGYKDIKEIRECQDLLAQQEPLVQQEYLARMVR